MERKNKEWNEKKQGQAGKDYDRGKGGKPGTVPQCGGQDGRKSVDVGR